MAAQPACCSRTLHICCMSCALATGSVISEWLGREGRGLWVPHDPISATHVKSNHRSLFALFHTCSTCFISLPQTSPPPPLHFIFSVRRNSQVAICQSRHFITATQTNTHTHTLAHMETFRPRELLWCIMTDNWLLWLCPRQQKPITVTATSL